MIRIKNVVDRLELVRDDCKWHKGVMQYEENAIMEVVFKGIADELDYLIRELKYIENKDEMDKQDIKNVFKQ